MAETNQNANAPVSISQVLNSTRTDPSQTSTTLQAGPTGSNQSISQVLDKMKQGDYSQGFEQVPDKPTLLNRAGAAVERGITDVKEGINNVSQTAQGFMQNPFRTAAGVLSGVGGKALESAADAFPPAQVFHDWTGRDVLPKELTEERTPEEKTGGYLETLGETALAGAAPAEAIAEKAQPIMRQGLLDTMKKVLNPPEEAFNFGRDPIQFIYDHTPAGRWQRMLGGPEGSLKLAKPAIEQEAASLSAEKAALLQQNSGKTVNLLSDVRNAFVKARQEALNRTGMANRANVNAALDRVELDIMHDPAGNLKSFTGTPAEMDAEIKSIDKNIADFSQTAKNSPTAPNQFVQRELLNVRTAIRDALNREVPGLSELNDKLSNATEAEKLLQSKFPELKTAEQARNSYLADALTRTGKAALAAGASAEIGIGPAYLAYRYLHH